MQRPAGSILASASLGHWGTASTPASKAAAAAAAAGGPLGSMGASPAVSGASDVQQLQQRQQHVVASTPQCAGRPPGVYNGAGGGFGGMSAAAAGGGAGTGGVTSAGSVSFAKSLGGGVYGHGTGGGITPLPLAAAHAPATGMRINSTLHRPSPLGPSNRDAAAGFTREVASGLQALLGPQARDGQQPQQQQEGAGGFGGNGGGLAGSAARRSMQLLPGSFRLGAGNTANSPGMDSPAVAAALAHSAALQAAAAGYADSPAGSVSLAPSIASAAPGNAATAEQQEQTPVNSNAQKHPCGMYAHDLQQQQLLEDAEQQQQQQDVYLFDGDSGGAELDDRGLAGEGGAAGRVVVPDHAAAGEGEVVLLPTGTGPLPASNTTPLPSSAAALAAAAVATSLPGGAHTPLSTLQALSAAAASVPSPAQQQLLHQHHAAAAGAGSRGGGGGSGGAEGGDAAAGVTHLFGTVPGGANLQDMTPSSLFIASLLASNRTPTDLFITSPLPQIGSALRQAGLASVGPTAGNPHPSSAQAAGGGARGAALGDGAACGVGIALRGGQVTPLSLHGLHHGVAGQVLPQTPGSEVLGAAGVGALAHGMTPKRGRGGRGGGLGVGALCTGILRGAAAEASATEQASAWGAGGAQQQRQQQLGVTAAAAAAGGGGVGSTGLEASAAAAAALGASAAEQQQEDAAASGMKPDTDKAAARAAAAAADTAAGAAAAAAAALAAGLTSPGAAAGVGSLLAAASYISTPRDASITRTRPLSGGEDAAMEGAPNAKRQRLHSASGTPASSKDGSCGRGGTGAGAGLLSQEHPAYLSPALFKSTGGGAAAAAAAKCQAEQDVKHEVDAAGVGGSAGGGGGGGGAAAAEMQNAGEGTGLMHPPKQQQQRHRLHSGSLGPKGHQQQMSALQQLLQSPHYAAAAAGPAEGQEGHALWDVEAWHKAQAVAAAGGGGEAVGFHESQQQQQQHVRLQQQRQYEQPQQKEEDMKSPPVPTQRRDIQGQVGFRFWGHRCLGAVRWRIASMW